MTEQYEYTTREKIANSPQTETPEEGLAARGAESCSYLGKEVKAGGANPTVFVWGGTHD